ncbi:hypothetical protein [Marinobacter sp.]|uniref:hypothetical protein n=1 Tax=Marinobacter sp. TaxID=50741 RepID=UPI00384D9E4C
MSQDLTLLNRQAIAAAKNHMGEVAWPTVILVAAVLAGFVGNLWLFAVGVGQERSHRLHREIEPILRAHGTPILGIFSRQPVEAAAPGSV